MDMTVDQKDGEDATTWRMRPQDTDRCSIASLLAAAATNPNQTTVSWSRTTARSSTIQ